MFSFFKSRKSSKNSSNNNRTSPYSTSSIGDSIKDKVEDLADTASDKIDEAKDAISENVEEVKNNSSLGSNEQEKENNEKKDETEVEGSDSSLGENEEPENKKIYSDHVDEIRDDFSPETDAYEEAQNSPYKEDNNTFVNNDSSPENNEDEDLVDFVENDSKNKESLEDDSKNEGSLEDEDNSLEEGSYLEDEDNSLEEGNIAEDEDSDLEEDNSLEEDNYVAPLPPGAFPASVPTIDDVPQPPAEEDAQDSQDDNKGGVTEEDFDFLVSEGEDESPLDEQSGSAESEPSTEERGDANEVPEDEDFAFIDSEEAFDEEVEKGQDSEGSHEDSSAEEGNSLSQKNENEEDNSDDVIDDLDSYFAPLEGEEKDLSDKEGEEPSPVLDRGPAEKEVDNPDAEFNGEDDSNITPVENERSSVPQGSVVNITPIVFEDCENNDAFVEEISFALDNREAYVFDFTENKSGHAILPSTIKEQFVELPEGELSPLDARTILNEAYKHPGCAVVVVGPEVITGEISKKFDRGSQGYNLIVDTVDNLLREASENDVEVITIGAKTNDLLDDIIESSSL